MKLQRVFGVVLGTVISSMIGVSTLTAQVKNPQLENPRYGADVEARKECLKNTSYYQEYYKQDNYKDAAHSWGIVYNICPRSSENIYIRGIRMIKASIEATQDPEVKNKLIDSLMRVYDKRITYYNKKGKNLASKGTDLYQYAPERSEQVYNILHEALHADKEKAEEHIFLLLMQTTKDLYLAKKLVADSVISTYSALSTLMASRIEGTKDASEQDRLKSMSEAMDKLFTSTGVANCDNLISIYTPKLEGKVDVAVAKAAYSQLSALECKESEVYLKAATTLFEESPSAALGFEIAKIYAAKRDYPKADSYYQKAIDNEQDTTRRSALMLEYATFVGNTMGEVNRARSLANEALKLNPKLGLAHFFIGSLYGSTRNCGSGKLANSSVYWAAVDKFILAKNVDPSIADECNKQIAYFSQYFPSREEIFFEDLEVGKSYHVPCWINESTTIRTKD